MNRSKERVSRERWNKIMDSLAEEREEYRDEYWGNDIPELHDLDRGSSIRRDKPQATR